MDKNTETYKELPEKILRLQLDWIKAADAKVPPVFAINIAMLGVISALVNNFEQWKILTAIFVSLFLISQLVSLFSVVFAMYPRLNGPKGSNIFFGGISNKDEDMYLQEMRSISEEELRSDFLKQIHVNAKIAAQKYYHVKIAFMWMLISAPFWLVSIFLLYT
jgi:hypothetical protein